MKHLFFFLSFFLSFITLSAQNQEDICTVMYDGSELLLTDCDTDYPGPFGIALTIHYLYEDDGSGGVSESSYQAVLAKLQQAFAPHGIYFLLKCVNRIEDSFLYSSVGDDLLTNSSYMDETTMNYVIKGTAGGGHALLGGNFALSGLDAPTYNIIGHEMGHALGLNHTFRGSNNDDDSVSGGLPEYVNGEGCCLRGDQICDTPADPNIKYTTGGALGQGQQEDCSWVIPTETDPNGDSFVNVDVENYMSYYGHCRNHFTEEQGARMRRHLVEDINLDFVRRDEALIAEDTEWNTDKYFDTDIRILSGNELQIEDATIHLAPYTRIIVDKGAVLKIRNSTLTVNQTNLATVCSPDPFWKGIELRGGDTNSEFPSLAVIYDSTIEFAEKGIYFPNQDLTSTHGRLYVARTDFRNNIRSLNLFRSNSSSLYDQLYTWSFVRCNFYLDEDFPQNAPFVLHAGLGTMPRVLFNGCSFSMPEYGLHDGAVGLFSYRSTIKLKSYCSPGYADDNCPEEQFMQSQVNGFEEGIWLAESHGSEINETHFSNCFSGVKIIESNNVSLRGNQFDVPPFLLLARAGLNIEESTGYTIVDNVFNNVDPSLAPEARGLTVLQSGEEPNMIANNSFVGFRKGISVFGNNYNPNLSVIGLTFFCNEHANTIPADGGFGGGGPYDFYANFSTIATLQGSSENPAGNKFSGHEQPPGSDFYKAGGNLVNYYYFIGDPVQNPENNVGLIKIPIEVDPNCAQYSNLIPDEPGDITGVYHDYVAAKNQIEDLIDGGDTDDLWNRVKYASVQEFEQVKSTLETVSPFVSAKVLAEALQREDVMSADERRAILDANPDELKEGNLREMIMNSTDFSEQDKEAILYGEKPTTVRSILEQELYDISIRTFPMANASIGQIYQDTTGRDFTNLRQFLSTRASINSDLQAVETYLSEGDWGGYANAVTGFVNTYSHIEGITAYSEFAATLQVLHARDRSFSSLDEAEVNDLIVMAEQCPNSLLFKTIANFLWAYYQIELEQNQSIQQNQSQQQAEEIQVDHEKKAVLSSVSEEAYQVFPNPADDYIVIQINNDKTITSALKSVSILNALQQPMFEADKVDFSTPFQIATITWKEGLYYLLISENGQLIYHQKIIVQ